MKDEDLALAQHPGFFIKKEIDKRGWTQADLAEIMARPLQLVNEIVMGKRGITPETAKGLSRAFGQDPEFWMRLDALHQLSLADDPGPDVDLRAQIFGKGPVKEMLRRGWVKGASDAKLLAQEVQRFFRLKSLEETPDFWPHAARKSTSYDDTTPAQTAWMFQALHMAEELPVTGEFKPELLPLAVRRLQVLIRDPEGVGNVPAVLSEAGIRFVVVEPLPQTRIDGVCFWIDETSPVIAMSLRYDRIDYFWHTLMHEAGHLSAGDGLTNTNARLDTDLIASHTPAPVERPDFEVAADEFAVEALVLQGTLSTFMAQSRPLYSRRRILDFAQHLGVHPGIIVGQLQYRGEILYSHSRDLLVKVRDLVIENAFTDGWGKAANLS